MPTILNFAANHEIDKLMDNDDYDDWQRDNSTAFRVMGFDDIVNGTNALNTAARKTRSGALRNSATRSSSRSSSRQHAK
jgi:hypothetical protein